MTIINTYFVRQGGINREYRARYSRLRAYLQEKLPAPPLQSSLGRFAANRVHIGVRMSGDGPTERLHLGRVGLGSRAARWPGSCVGGRRAAGKLQATSSWNSLRIANLQCSNLPTE